MARCRAPLRFTPAKEGLMCIICLEFQRSKDLFDARRMVAAARREPSSIDPQHLRDVERDLDRLAAAAPAGSPAPGPGSTPGSSGTKD